MAVSPRWSIGRTCLLLGSLAAASSFAGQAAAQNDLLPDMTPWVSEDQGFLHGWQVEQTNGAGSPLEISVTTVPLNIGAGDLELYNTGVTQGSGDNTQWEMNQRIYDDQGGYRDVFAGWRSFDPLHSHLHVEGYAQNRLRAVTGTNGVGDIVAEGEKISFCLIDYTNFNSPNSEQFISCGATHQGISAGWADVYGWWLPGQQIDVSGLARNPDGTLVQSQYWLEIELDVDNLMVESDETNNIARILVDLNNPGQALDDHSDNYNSATWINPNNAYRFGEINANNDKDFFRIQTIAGQTYIVTMRELTLETGDMHVYDTTGTNQIHQVDLNASGQQLVEFTFTATEDGFYHFEAGETGPFSSSDDGSFQLKVELIHEAGDLNGDNVVDDLDLQIVLGNWGQSTVAGDLGRGDASVDGVVGLSDLQQVLDNWSNGTAPNVVPEPTSLALLGLGGLLIARRRRRA